MHDVLDPRDYVPDEAEQLRLSGYDLGGLDAEVRAAAARGDLLGLRELELRMDALERDPAWPYHEPEDDASLEPLFASAPRTAVEVSELRDRYRGAWLGRTVANTLGKPVEGLTRNEVEIYLRAAGQWPVRGYLPLLSPLPGGVERLHPSAPLAAAGRFDDVPRDDDIDWTILGVHLLETYGRGLDTQTIAAEWLDRLPFTQTFTAERAAYRNLVRGVAPSLTATTSNPYREWIGALIRGDAYGFALPGDPGSAARLALVDARLTHTANGLYGELWAAALVSAALASRTAQQVVQTASAVVPPSSRLAECIESVVALHREGRDHVEALDWVDTALRGYPWVHTLNNAALIVIGLLWGRSFIDSVGITISGGRDTDSNAATVGCVLGALHGAASIPGGLVGSTHVRVRSAVRDFDRISIDQLTDRTLEVARRFASS